MNQDRLADVLRCDDNPESLAFVRFYDKLTPKQRSAVGVEAMALACSMTPRRLWELFQGAAVVQSRESVGAMIAAALPDVFRVTIKNARKQKGHADREHLYKVSGSLPTPKGATTNINLGQPQQAALTEGDEEEGKGDLPDANDFLLSASKAMGVKQLTAPKVANAEVVEPVEE